MPDDDPENLEWCHIHAQYLWHGEARIEGTRKALHAICVAIDKALHTGMDAEAGLIAADGEGYRVKISIRNLAHLEQQTLPYTAHWAGGIGSCEAQRCIDEELKQSDELDEYYEGLNG